MTEAKEALADLATAAPLAVRQTAFRLPTSLIDRIDARAAQMRATHPGLSITRADVVRMLLEQGLADDDTEVTP